MGKCHRKKEEKIRNIPILAHVYMHVYDAAVGKHVCYSLLCLYASEWGVMVSKLLKLEIFPNLKRVNILNDVRDHS